MASRYERQLALWGKEGQKKIGTAPVAIVGLGGLGSHVAQQLAYLGAKHFVLIDHDVIEDTNLNRLIGAMEDDVGKKKVDVAQRMIQSIQPDAVIAQIAQSLLTKDALEALGGVEFIFGCVDDDGVRVVLLETACFYKKPYLDLATEISREGDDFGGRLVLSLPEEGCLKCRDKGEILDGREIRRFFSSTEQNAELDKFYGIDGAALGDSGPSVVMLNGIIASLGVLEYAKFITASPHPRYAHLTLRGSLGTVNIPNPKTTLEDCYFCKGISRSPESVDIFRHALS